MEQVLLDYKDMMEKFKCGRDKARGIIKAIKEISDIAGIRGKVTKTDYDAWLYSPIVKLEKERQHTTATNEKCVV